MNSYSPCMEGTLTCAPSCSALLANLLNALALKHVSSSDVINYGCASPSACQGKILALSGDKKACTRAAIVFLTFMSNYFAGGFSVQFTHFKL